MYVCAPYAFRVCTEQKRALDPLELKLETIVSHHVGAGIGTRVLEEQQVLLMHGHFFLPERPCLKGIR